MTDRVRALLMMLSLSPHFDRQKEQGDWDMRARGDGSTRIRHRSHFDSSKRREAAQQSMSRFPKQRPKGQDDRGEEGETRVELSVSRPVPRSVVDEAEVGMSMRCCFRSVEWLSEARKAGIEKPPGPMPRVPVSRVLRQPPLRHFELTRPHAEQTTIPCCCCRCCRHDLHSDCSRRRMCPSMESKELFLPSSLWSAEWFVAFPDSGVEWAQSLCRSIRRSCSCCCCGFGCSKWHSKH